MKDAGILKTMTPADVVAKSAAPIADAILLNMHDREFLDRCKGMRSSLDPFADQVLLDLQTDQIMNHLMAILPGRLS